MDAEPLLVKALHEMTTKYTYCLGESISIGHGGDFANADFSTLPKIAEINGYRFELEGGIKGHFHTYRVVGLPSGSKQYAFEDGFNPYAPIWPSEDEHTRNEVAKLAKQLNQNSTNVARWSIVSAFPSITPIEPLPFDELHMRDTATFGDGMSLKVKP